MVKLEAHSSREAIIVWCYKALNENFIIGTSWGSAKLFTMQNYTDKANGDVPLTVENM